MERVHISLLRDVSVTFLALTALILAIVPLLLLGALVYGLWRLQRHQNLPSWLRLLRAYLSLVQAYVELATAAAVRPILMVSCAHAAAQGWLGAFMRLLVGGRR